jgi:lysozyme
LWFILNVPEDDNALPPVLDVEWNSHSRTCPHLIARDTAIAKIKIMLEAMEAGRARHYVPVAKEYPCRF